MGVGVRDSYGDGYGFGMMGWCMGLRMRYACYVAFWYG